MQTDEPPFIKNKFAQLVVGVLTLALALTLTPTPHQAHPLLDFAVSSDAQDGTEP